MTTSEVDLNTIRQNMSEVQAENRALRKRNAQLEEAVKQWADTDERCICFSVPHHKDCPSF